MKLIRRDRALKKCRQGRKSNCPGLARSGVFVVLKPLEPDADADLMNSFADLHVILIRKKISVIVDARGVVRARGSDRPAGGGCRSSAHDDSAGACSGDKGHGAGRDRADGGPTEGFTPIRLKDARENPTVKCIENLGRKDVRFLQAEHLHAKRRVRREQRIGERNQAVPVVDRISTGKSVAIPNVVVGSKCSEIFLKMFVRIVVRVRNPARDQEFESWSWMAPSVPPFEIRRGQKVM